jgi:hypothetical protein
LQYPDKPSFAASIGRIQEQSEGQVTVAASTGNAVSGTKKRRKRILQRGIVLMLHHRRLPYQWHVGKIRVLAFTIDAILSPSAIRISVTPVPAFATVPFARQGIDTPAHTIGQVSRAL